MFVVKKPAETHSEIIRALRIVRVCPLAPRITGPALRNATPYTALDLYDEFYINKYYSISDFLYINNL